jgi:cytochrome c-type biogenesis protein CcmF
VAHAGLGLLLLGVAGTASGVIETVPVAPGDSVSVLGQSVDYGGVSVDEDVSSAGGPVDNATAVVADIHAAGHDLSPSLVAYPTISRGSAETSLVSGPWRDVQVGLRDADDDGRAVIQIGVHPLQVLVWWGGLVIVAAALLTVVERRPRRSAATISASAEQVGPEGPDPLPDPPHPPVPIEL